MLDRQTITRDQGGEGAKLFEDAYANRIPAPLRLIEEHKAETATVMVLGTIAAALLLRGPGRGLAFSGAKNGGFASRSLALAGEGQIARAFDPKKYHTVAAEVRGFSRSLDDFLGKNQFLRSHDARAHVLTLKNPATVGGELRGAISESVARQMIDGRRKYPLFHEAVERYEDVRIILRNGGYSVPKIPEKTLRRWFDLSQARMEENFQLWRFKPRTSNFDDLKDLPVPRKWS